MKKIMCIVLLMFFVELAGMNKLLAQLFALGMATLASYIAQHWWVFRNTERSG